MLLKVNLRGCGRSWSYVYNAMVALSARLAGGSEDRISGLSPIRRLSGVVRLHRVLGVFAPGNFTPPSQGL